MGAFEVGWSVLKSNPAHQAFQDLFANRHPDLHEGETMYGSDTPRVLNLGTIDPRVVLYSMLARSGSRDLARAFLENDEVHDFRSDDDYAGGFTSERPDLMGSVSRESRPVAYRLSAPEGSPQRLLEDLEIYEEVEPFEGVYYDD